MEEFRITNKVSAVILSVTLFSFYYASSHTWQKNYNHILHLPLTYFSQIIITIILKIDCFFLYIKYNRYRYSGLDLPVINSIMASNCYDKNSQLLIQEKTKARLFYLKKIET